jgi:cytoskeletal protein CcmA (bactofilin family)
MALESATYISDLVTTNPTSSDNVSDGDNHIRLLKSTVKTTFPNITGAVTSTHTAINSAVVAANAATSANTASTIVSRDASGNFTAGTITAALTGNVTGNLTGDVTGNTSGTASALATARAITLDGDVSGTADFDGSAAITITATVADDSHAHVIANVDGLQTALDAKLDATANAVSAAKWQTARTITLAGDVSGSVSLDGTSDVNITATVADDSHAHIISNVDGLQTAIDAKLDSTSYTASDVLTKIKTVDGSGSGLDADTVDGVEASAFVQDSDFTQSLSANGWVKFPNGLTIQWGRTSVSANTANAYRTFPTSFSTACLQVVASYEESAVGAGDNSSIGTTSPTTSGFYLTNGQGSTSNFRWIAIGY